MAIRNMLPSLKLTDLEVGTSMIKIIIQQKYWMEIIRADMLRCAVPLITYRGDEFLQHLLKKICFRWCYYRVRSSGSQSNSSDRIRHWFLSGYVCHPIFHKLTDPASAQRQIFLQLYQRVNIFQWKEQQITDFPFFLFFISGIYRQFDPESRLTDHFSVILFRPACAPSPVLHFSFYCQLLQLSPGTFF